MRSRDLTIDFDLNDYAIQLDGVFVEPKVCKAVLLLCHGAGAGFRHATMQRLAEVFAEQGIASLRFNSPFMQQQKRRVDNIEVAVAAIKAAASVCRDLCKQPSAPFYLAGHSFGGRMCSHAVAQGEVDCDGLVFCSFPLHVAKKPSTKRAEHLPAITKPMLFLSGTRDDLANRELLQDVVGGLADAKLHWLETANHSYVVLKRSRTNPQDVFAEMAEAVANFVGA